MSSLLSNFERLQISDGLLLIRRIFQHPVASMLYESGFHRGRLKLTASISIVYGLVLIGMTVFSQAF